MKKIFLLIIIIILSIPSFSAIYSEKVQSIPTSFDTMPATSILLTGYKGEKTQSFLKVAHTNNEIFIGLKLKDFNISALDKAQYNENKSYSKDRVEIFISDKSKKASAYYIISPGGIVFDEFNKNSSLNNKYKISPTVTKEGWEFVLVIDKKSLLTTSLYSDDYLIKVIRKSHRDNIPTQAITEDANQWTDLYFTDDLTAFKNFETKLNIRLNELSGTDYPESLQARQEKYLNEINSLKATKDRVAVEKITSIYNKLNCETTYYLGAYGQSKITSKPILPYMFSFVDFNKYYSQKGLNSYVNKLEYKSNIEPNEKVCFGVIVSAYEDIHNLSYDYQGDLKENVKIGNIEPVENVCDLFVISHNSTWTIPAGESRILFMEFTPNGTNKEYKGEITLTVNDQKTILPVKINVGNTILPENDTVVANLEFNSFAKDLCHNNFGEFTQNMGKLCKYLSSNNIKNLYVNIMDSDFLFNYKENEFGKYQINGKNFDLFLKILKLNHIENLYIEGMNLSSNKTKAFANELVFYAKNSDVKIFLTNKDLFDNTAKEILSGNIKFAEDLIYTSYTQEDSLMTPRRDLWNSYLKDNDLKLVVPLSNLIYYSVNNDEVEFIPSLRFKTLHDGVVDLQYLKAFNDKISDLKKNNKGNEANVGENKLSQFKDLVLVKSPQFLTATEFNKMKDAMQEFIKD